MVVIRCSKCRRPFSSYADRCPDCGHRSPRGFTRVVTHMVSVIVAIMALVIGFLLCLRSARSNHQEHTAFHANLQSSSEVQPPTEPERADIQMEPR